MSTTRLTAGETLLNSNNNDKEEKSEGEGQLKTVTSNTNIPKNNTWSYCDSSVFHLRVGPNYQKNGLKAPSNQALYNIVGIDVIKTPNKIDNIGAKVRIPDEWKSIRCNRNGVPPIFIVNLQMPSEFPTTIFKTITDGPGWSIVFYFSMSQNTCDALNGTIQCSNAINLFAQYCANAPENINHDNSPWKGRFKLVARCQNIDDFGFPSFITSYNAKPVLIKNTGTLIRGQDYIEMDINVHSFGSVPKKALQTMLNRFDRMIINAGFCIESLNDSEMPETLFGCATLNQPSTDAKVVNF